MRLRNVELALQPQILSRVFLYIDNPRQQFGDELLFIQSELGYPGLITECEGLVDKLKLPDIRTTSLSKLQWKKIVKKSIVEKN